MKKHIILLILVLTIFLVSCKADNPTGKITIDTKIQKDTVTFSETGDDICTSNGKPIIRKFATTWCPHCQWIKETYMDVVDEYVKEGKIVAYLWEVDIGDDALTEKIEKNIPKEELAIYKKYNPEQSIPTFVFGCKYLRIGNGYESQGNLEAEEQEFRKIIDELISIANN